MSEPIQISELLEPSRVVVDSDITSKKRLMERLSELLAEGLPDVTAADVLGTLQRRERLGSTGLGRGVALPHGRLAGLDRCTGAFIKLDQAVSYDAIDGMPVDLAFGLLVPEQATESHLNILARLAEAFGNRKTCEQLREQKTGDALHTMLLARTTEE